MQWQAIDVCIQNKSLLKHPFYQAWSNGQLTLEDLRFYATQYYALESTFPRLLSAIHFNCDDPNLRQIILQNLNDEELGEENHRELWLRFAEGLGLNRQAAIQAPLHEKTKQCITQLKKLASNSNPAIGLASLYAYESQIPQISKTKIKGLQDFYQITHPRAIQFFELHAKLDEWHADQLKNAITQCENANQVNQLDIYTSVDQSCDALWTFLDGVYQETSQFISSN